MKKKILFVDDESRILEGLKRMLRPMRKEWDMSFASSGQEALDILSKNHFDVVVSDMRMPGMDGGQLLTKVMELYPHIIRIVLSGQSEQEMIMKSVRPTHQFLSKPCSAEMIKSVIQRSLDLRDMLASDALKDAVSQIQSLPSLPAFYNKIMKTVQSPKASLKDIGEIIEHDVAMTAQILKLVNSAYFGFYRNISNPVQAVTILGVNTIKTLVLSIEIFSIFETDKDYNFSFDKLWERCTLTGTFAKNIAKDISKDQHFIDDAFTAGFLHDVGIIALASRLPEDYKQILNDAAQKKITISEAEFGVLRSTHAEIGAYLLGLWGFSDDIVEAIAMHHKPIIRQDEPFSLMTIIHLADIFVQDILGQSQGIQMSKLDENYIEKLNLKEHRLKWLEKCKEIYEAGENK